MLSICNDLSLTSSVLRKFGHTSKGDKERIDPILPYTSELTFDKLRHLSNCTIVMNDNALATDSGYFLLLQHDFTGIIIAD